MKGYYLSIPIFFFILLFLSCSDENPVGDNFSSYHGTWLLLKTEGGLFPREILPEDGVTIKIKYDNYTTNYSISRNDSLKIMANYKIEINENDYDKISYSNIKEYNYNYNTSVEFAEIKSDTLLIWDGQIDGFFSYYKKLD